MIELCQRAFHALHSSLTLFEVAHFEVAKRQHGIAWDLRRGRSPIVASPLQIPSLVANECRGCVRAVLETGWWGRGDIRCLSEARRLAG